MVRVHLDSPAATGHLGRVLVRLLHAPALVTLAGELGTGKTTLVRAAFRAAGVRGPVVSPSFTIAQSYSGRRGLRLHHLDLYRLSPGADVELFAWDDYLTADALTFVEWPEAGSHELPPADVRLTLFHDTPHSRWAEAEAGDALESALVAAMAAEGATGRAAVIRS
jgi:tRNA threonylcarbamoyladenosine biosynthesis protein TsaE